jgi:hypothetical protein
MKSPFTLIYTKSEKNKPQKRNAVDTTIAPKKPTKKTSVGGRAKGKLQTEGQELPHLKTIRKIDRKLVKPLEKINPNLSRTLLQNTLLEEELCSNVAEAVEQSLKPVVLELQRTEKVITVALWDLDTRIGHLPRIVELLTRSQSHFTFFETQAPIPTGLVLRSENFMSWAKKNLSKKDAQIDQSKLKDNLMFNEFHRYARKVHKDLGVDYLVGITRYMVAGEDEDGFYWNYFSTSQGKFALVSSYGLREYAAKAERPFEVAIAMLVLSQVLVLINRRLGFHENTGCIFDFNEDRVSIVNSLKRLEIDSDCWNKIEEKYRQPVSDMLTALRSYLTPDEQTNKSTQPKTKEKDKSDSYYLKQLEKLSSQKGEKK